MSFLVIMCDEYYRQIYRLHMQRIKEEEEEELEEDEEELLVCCCCVAALLGTHGAYRYMSSTMCIHTRLQSFT